MKKFEDRAEPLKIAALEDRAKPLKIAFGLKIGLWP